MATATEIIFLPIFIALGYTSCRISSYAQGAESAPEVGVLQTLTMMIRRDGRGRPKAPWRSMSDLVSFGYLIKLSRKYEINTLILLKCLHKAWIKGESSYKGLAIIRRQRLEDAGIFQVNQDRRIIGQFRLTGPILDYFANLDLSNLRFEDYERSETKPIPKNLKIKDLNSQTKSRFNVAAKVIEKSPTLTVTSQWGTTSLLSTATITDGTGTIKLPLWRDKINIVSVGDSIRIENARVRRFRDELQIKVDRFARLRIEDR